MTQGRKRALALGVGALLAASSGAQAQPPVDTALKRNVYQPGDARTVYHGSGFWVDNAGALVTARHVVEACSTIIVSGWGTSQPAHVVALSGADDMALLKADRTTTMPAIFPRAGQSEAGEPVLAAGFDDLKTLRATGIVANGLVQQAGGPGAALELTMTAEPGASGAPVLNRYGLLEGMLRSKSNAQVAANGRISAGPHLSAVPGAAIRAFVEQAGVTPARSDDNQLSGTQSVVARASTLTQSVLCW